MYSDQTNIRQLVSLLSETGITNIVLCPGSRNAAIVHTLTNLPQFDCRLVTDERSAAFFALGWACSTGKPAAVCCTSGSALLNMHPAVAEAFYQEVPLLIISADRPAAWIGQMDGQTLPQPNVFGALVRRSVNLPQVKTKEDQWFCNRLINEALLELNHNGKGPVHINIPVSEPIYSFVPEPPEKERIISRVSFRELVYPSEIHNDEAFRKLFNTFITAKSRLFVAGQLPPRSIFPELFKGRLSELAVFLSEHLANKNAPQEAIENFDALLLALPEKDKEKLRPDLLITYGGHVVSKQLKLFLRKNPPKAHWHISPDGKVTDLFGALSTVIECEPEDFFRVLSEMAEDIFETPQNFGSEYLKTWHGLSQKVPVPTFSYSQESATGALMKRLPASSVLHLANSSTVRYAQLFALPEGVSVTCNRGVNGIEGSLSAAVGYASATPNRLNFVIIGDLSFFYDMNALWNENYGANLRILLINNGGGEIFATLPGIDLHHISRTFIGGEHKTKAEGWARSVGFEYHRATDSFSLEEGLEALSAPASDSAARPVLLEVFTNQAKDIELLKRYYQTVKAVFQG